MRPPSHPTSPGDWDFLSIIVHPGYSLCLCVHLPFEQARNLLGTMLSHEPPERGTMDGVLGRAFFAGGASVTAAKLQVYLYLHGFPDAFLNRRTIEAG